MKKNLFFAAAFLLVAGGAMAQGNTGTVTQTGNANSSQIEQAGRGNVATTKQSQNGNTSSVSVWT
ncbi:hypothetical protein GCM10028895_18350 [Pontibacter rugosus]